MSTSINGTGGVTFPNGSVLASGSTALINRIIDGGFIINQRGYVSGTALSAGVYAHDRWKAGSGGGTYTFTQAATGVNTTITITAGTMAQVIEGCNVPEGGTYTLSWTGTAQGSVNGGSYGSSPLTVTGLTAGSNVTIEFNTGTLGSVQFETGSAASSFNYRSYPQELALCQRYYEKSYNTDVAPATNTQVGSTITWAGQSGSTTLYSSSFSFKVTKRATPTMSFWTYDGTSGQWHYGVMGSSEAKANVTANNTLGMNSLNVYCSPGVSGQNTMYGHFAASAEL